MIRGHEGGLQARFSILESPEPGATIPPQAHCRRQSFGYDVGWSQYWGFCMKRLWAALLMTVLPLPAAAQGSAPDVAAAKALWEGNQLFCKNCHGKDGEGAFGPDLAGRGLSA